MFFCPPLNQNCSPLIQPNAVAQMQNLWKLMMCAQLTKGNQSENCEDIFPDASSGCHIAPTSKEVMESPVPNLNESRNMSRTAFSNGWGDGNVVDEDLVDEDGDDGDGGNDDGTFLNDDEEGDDNDRMQKIQDSVEVNGNQTAVTNSEVVLLSLGDALPIGDDTVIQLSGEAVKELYKGILENNKLLRSIDRNIQNMKGSMKKSKKNSLNELQVSEKEIDFDQDMPISSMEKMAEVESKLKCPIAKTNFLSKLDDVGGSNLNEAVRKTMRTVFTDSMCDRYTLMVNKAEKEGFINTALYSCVFATIKSNEFFSVKDDMIQSAIGKWLTGANCRMIKKEKNKKGNKNQQQTPQERPREE